jgi:FkbM family methyltransferase
VTQVAEPGAVVAFEPAPSCWDALRPLLENVPNGRLIRAAVGAASGEIELNCAADSRLSSVLPATAAIKELFTPDYEVVQTIKSSLVRLDDTIAPDAPIGLLKIDVQGYELEVLRGADRVLQQSSAVLIEVNYLQHYESAVSFNEIHGFLSDKGFQLNGISRPFMHRGRPLWADAMYTR